MDMTNIKSGNGFVASGDLLIRMHGFRPAAGEHYQMRKLPNSDFSEIAVKNPKFGLVTVIMFKIYTGNEELYDYIKQLFFEAAKALNQQAKAEDWRQNS